MSRVNLATASAQAPTQGAPTPAPSPKPPRGPSTRNVVVALISFVVALILGTVFSGRVRTIAQDGWQMVFHHTPPSGAAATTATVQYYTSPMHPWLISARPGVDPECGMALVPIDPAKFSAEVAIDPVVAQNIGIRVATVTRGPVVQTIRTVGSVTYDQKRVREVNLKVGGWIEKLDVDFMGAAVKRGQPLLALYSPALYTAQEEYLVAWKNRAALGAGADPDGVRDADALLQASRTKIEYFDLTAQQIEDLQKRGTPSKTMTLLSPYDGVVIAKDALEGMKVDAGTRLYRLADLSKVWVMATLYEDQLPYVQLGQAATMSLSYLPGRRFQGRVIYIDPYLNDKTRQVEVRLEFDNPDGLLKPGMYATVDLYSTLANDRTLAPRSAVIDTGQRQVAFVSLGEGRFEPRQVQTGVQAQDGTVEILKGLQPDEQVVTSGEFLLDSEANVREALAKMVQGNLAVDQAEATPAATVDQRHALPRAAAKPLQAILSHYLAIQRTLARDSTDGLTDSANAMARGIVDLLNITVPADPHFWHEHAEINTIRDAALKLPHATSLESARLLFVDISAAMDALLKATGVPPGMGSPIRELHCPMYHPDRGGADWLQPAGQVRNPYLGASMPTCGQVVSTLATMPTNEGDTAP